MRFHTVKDVADGVSIQQLRESFQTSTWGGVITDDPLPADAVKKMTPEAIANIKALEIEFIGDTALARINHWNKHPTNRVEFIDLASKGSESKTGLPLIVQQRLVLDLKEFQELTGRHAVTHLYIGDRLETEWHSMRTKSRVTPLMIRDLSGHGMYYAVPRGSECQIMAENEHAPHMVDKGALMAAFANRALFQKQLPAGHRIFCNNDMIRREYWVAADGKPMVANLRSMTAAYNF